MSLTEAEKQRIREEELVRLQARDEYRLTHRTPPIPCHSRRTLLFWAMAILAVLLLWSIARTKSKRDSGPTAGTAILNLAV